MAYPRMKTCPTCNSDDRLGVYTYESGWRHVECTKCNYMGPGEGSIRQAIKSHNEKWEERRTVYLEANEVAFLAEDATRY
ncbi:MAG: YheV family putative metal-binding protein [Notoacmeibacter sp.]|nr:YheV family putative metal-binding protein [Notoacmeibacter sp.]